MRRSANTANIIERLDSIIDVLVNTAFTSAAVTITRSTLVTEHSDPAVGSFDVCTACGYCMV